MKSMRKCLNIMDDIMVDAGRHMKRILMLRKVRLLEQAFVVISVKNRALPKPLNSMPCCLTPHCTYHTQQLSYQQATSGSPCKLGLWTLPPTLWPEFSLGIGKTLKTVLPLLLRATHHCEPS